MLKERVDLARAVGAYPLARTKRWWHKLPLISARRADTGIRPVFPLWVLGWLIGLFLCALFILQLLDASAEVRLVVLCVVPYLVVIVGILRGGILARRRLRAQSAARFEDEMAAMPEDGTLALQRAENLVARASRGGLLLTQRLIQHAFLTTVIAVSIVALAAYATLEGSHALVVVAACCFEAFAIGGLLITRQRVQELEGDMRQADYERSLLVEHASDEERAEKLFLRQQFEVKHYYDETLRQSAILSYLGILCIAGGFAVIGAAFALIMSASEDQSQQIIVAALGAAGGLLANFVAVVFLHMHAGTVKALTSFHERLVSTHHVHFGNVLAARVENDGDRDDVLGEMAVRLSRAAVPVSEEGDVMEPSAVAEKAPNGWFRRGRR